MAEAGYGSDRLDYFEIRLFAGMKVADFGKKKGSGPEGVAAPRGAGGKWNGEEA